MAGSRFVIGYGDVPTHNTGGNTVRKRWFMFFHLPVLYREDWRTYLRLSALVWADSLSGFALYMMMNYLTNVWNLSTTHAAGIINIFNGVVPALAIVLSFFVETFVGDFYILVLSSMAYTIGLGLLSLSTPTLFGPCSPYNKEECIGHTQKVIFFTALPLIAVGQAGQHASLESFINVQNKARVEARAQALAATEARAAAEAEDRARAEALAYDEAAVYAEALDEAYAKALAETEAGTVAKALDLGAIVRDKAKALGEAGVKALIHVAEAILSLIVVLMIGTLVILCGGIALPYIKPWSIRFGIPAICALIATVFFLTGSSQYKRSKPEGNPLTISLRVFVAAAAKDFQQVTKFKQIYTEDNTRSTRTLRWLDKAAIKYPDQAWSRSWTLCSVREVEDTKTGIRMVPMLLTFIGTGLVLSLGNTYFLEQANHMDRKLGSINIQIPIFLVFYNSSASISEFIYALLVRHVAVPERYYTPTRIAVGMVFSVLCCVTAAVVETHRLHVIRNHGLLDKSNERIPMSVFFLLPQFVLLGAVDGLTSYGIKRFFSDQLPKSMHMYLLYFQKFVLGLGSMASVLTVYVVGIVSERNSNPNWFQHTSSKSRLDRYYWTLVGLSAVNLVIFAIVASFYTYKDSPLADVELEGE